ncbi:hypothetical protein [Microcoleus sp. B3-C5]|uniref:hypothetical protein n=2 Tax=Microcoleus TaxID=44471 RepID=UPI002FD3DB5B
MRNLHRLEFTADRKARKANTPNISSVIVSLLISGFTIFFTISYLPVLPKIHLPMTFLDLGFLILPATFLAAIATRKLVRDIKNLWRNYSRLALCQTSILFSSLLLLMIGFNQAFYHENPVNNFNAYVKHREEIVALLHSGQLKGEKQSSTDDYNRGIKISLPEKFKGLSRGGEVRAIANGGVLEVIFIHSTMGFGDGTRYFIYRSDSDERKISFFIRKQKPPFVNLKKLKNRWFYLALSY